MTITAPVDHGRERPAKRCLLEKVTKEAELHLDESNKFQECWGKKHGIALSIYYHLYLRLLFSQITLSYLLSICLFVHP